MDLQQIMQAISTTGFPIAVTIYLLIERRGDTKALTTAVTNLCTMLQRLLDKEGLKGYNEHSS
jgi:hypothetical protein